MQHWQCSRFAMGLSILYPPGISSNLHISHNAPNFAPRNFALALFSISLGKAVIPKRNEKQRLCKICGGRGEGQIRCKWRIGHDLSCGPSSPNKVGRIAWRAKSTCTWEAKNTRDILGFRNYYSWALLPESAISTTVTSVYFFIYSMTARVLVDFNCVSD